MPRNRPRGRRRRGKSWCGDACGCSIRKNYMEHAYVPVVGAVPGFWDIELQLMQFVLRTSYEDRHPGPNNVPYRSRYGWPVRRDDASAHWGGRTDGPDTAYEVRRTSVVVTSATRDSNRSSPPSPALPQLPADRTGAPARSPTSRRVAGTPPSRRRRSRGARRGG